MDAWDQPHRDFLARSRAMFVRSTLPTRRRVCLSCELLESREMMDAASAAAIADPSVNTVPTLPASFLEKVSTTPDRSVSTIPKNGDLNPYGVAGGSAGRTFSHLRGSHDQA